MCDAVISPWAQFRHLCMPYSLEVLIENLINPAHMPVTHHGLIPRMVRKEAKPLWMKPCPVMFPQSIVSSK